MMKKTVLTVVAFVMATVSVWAQHEEGDYTIEPRVGITMSTLTGVDDAKMKVNVTYGVDFEHFLTDELSLGYGLLFTDIGAKFKSEDATMKIYYASIPLTVNYYVLPGLAVKAGLQPSYRVKSSIEVDGTKIDMDKFLMAVFQDDDYNMHKFDLSIPLGLSYELYGVTLDARYNLSLTKLFSGLDDSVRNQVITVTLGYKF